MRFAGALTLTHNATTLILPGGANITTAAGDTAVAIPVSGGWYVFYQKNIATAGAFGARLIATSTVNDAAIILPSRIQPINASVAASALTLTLNPTTLDFRSSSLTSGTVNTREIASAISIVVPSGATLGTINAVQNQLIVLAIDNAGTIELAVVNIAGGTNLDETTLISTTALSAASDSNNVVYSTTARTNVPFRVVGTVVSTQATAGTWATAPSLIQGAGGQAVASLGSFGQGQVPQNVTGSRVLGTTYYNTTGRPIFVHVVNQMTIANASAIVTVGGISFAGSSSGAATYLSTVSAVVPPGVAYSVDTTSATLIQWREIR
jgi:hypothetical protein